MTIQNKFINEMAETKKEIKKCCKCKKEQEIDFKTNIYQDISGYYLMCLSCQELTAIEI
jgi:hypothetical protein